uniref:Uncharacterized protein n=1 Tax=Ditylum brightwellii TaxID=49249 RepID=A0A7S1YSF3_9STRA|mmetsp:Transcript_16195/g.24000  ORF Transcript_16195/g.24000 Transcript_16195/m.24000 type:complete len:353 (+) Transcript_16195:264-1322(+)
MIASPLSTVLYSTSGPDCIVRIMAFLPLCMLPLVYYLKELRVNNADAGSFCSGSDDDDDDELIVLATTKITQPFDNNYMNDTTMNVKSAKEQCHEIWTTVCSRAVWQPMIFVYIYNLLQVGNAAWREYLKSVLHFTSTQLNALLIMAYILLYLGVITYKYFLLTWSWRTVYVLVILLNGVFSALQLCLITGYTFGLSPFVFALGDDAFGDFLEGIQFLPITIMMVHLCPSGSEGASYAMFTTVSNSAINLSVAISTVMLGIWDVSKQTLISGDLSGMMKLTILTTMMQTSAVLFIKLMPNTKDDLAHLHKASYSGSKVGGFTFLAIVLLSILYSIVVAVLNIFKPGWSGESR